MLCDELKVYVPQDGPWGLEPEEGGKLVEEETCYLKSDVDAAIDELKTEHHKERDEYISMVYSREQTIKELKKKLEDVQASAYADSVDAGMENRRLKEERRWRKFPEEKPKWGEEVLVVDDESKQYIVRFSHDMKWISWGNMNTCESNCVKYWMPLPKAPKDAK